jgi:hypothetical protein
MKRLVLMLLAVFSVTTRLSASYPEVIHVIGDRFHVQGIAFDQKKNCLYCSFTSTFLKTDLQGNVTGSITGINGHLGAMTFNPKTRKVYASLEIKNDAIGRNISDGLGVKRHEESQSGFYFAEIAVDKIKGPDVKFEEVVRLYPVAEAAKDYIAAVNIDGKELKHRFGCSGIDGVTIGPEIGSKSKKTNCLYVAYGIYRDTERKDNDYNILLCYDLNDLGKPLHKYFIYTGNTTYGVQNLAYDPYTEKIFMAVYPGVKAGFPNYGLFAVDVNQKAQKGLLKEVPYQSDEVEQLEVCDGWHFKWGSTGLCPLGDGRYYISHNGKQDGKEFCKATLYFYSDSEESPFIMK